MTAAYEQPRKPLRMTLKEYFDFTANAEEKYEYREGEVVAMSGGTARHSLIISNLNREIGNLLKGSPCRTYDSNLLIHNKRLAVYSYPDVSVICGELQFDPDDQPHAGLGEAACNPTLLVEVLSPTTEAYDRGKKFERAMSIDTLREYVIVDQNQPHIERRYREDDGRWTLHFTGGIDAVVELASLGIELPLADVYANAVFPAKEPTGAVNII